MSTAEALALALAAASQPAGHNRCRPERKIMNKSNLVLVGPVDEVTQAADQLRCRALWIERDGPCGCDYSGPGAFDPMEVAILDDLQVVFLVYAPETTEQMAPRYSFLARAGLTVSAVVVLPADHDLEEERESQGLPPLPEGFLERDAVLRRVTELVLEGGPSIHPREWGGDVPYFFTDSETGVPEIRFLSNNNV